MSEALNDVFIDNFQKDPTLTWQYFGSSTGFFRLYPGTYPSESHYAPCTKCLGELFKHVSRNSAVDKHSATQAIQYTSTATDDAQNNRSNRMTRSTAPIWLLMSPLLSVCVCVQEIHTPNQPAKQQFSHSAFDKSLSDSLQGSSGFQMKMVCPLLIAETEIGKIIFLIAKIRSLVLYEHF